jgi:hypothetical protein
MNAIHEAESYKAIGGYHAITVRLISALQTGKPGDEKTDAELSEVAGFPTSVGGKGYAYLCSAIRYCDRLGVVWQRVKSEGKIVCLNGGEVLARSGGDVRHIGRTARRSAGRLALVDTTSLPQQDRPRALAIGAQLGAIMLMSKPEATKRLASQPGAPQIGDALRMFGKGE